MVFRVVYNRRKWLCCALRQTRERSFHKKGDDGAMEEFFDTALDTALDTASDGRLTEIAHMTDIITIALISMVIVANITAIILLIVLYRQTRRPKNVSERYKQYKTTVGTVVSVEKVAYYIKRYVKKEHPDEEDGKKKVSDLPKVHRSTASPVEKSDGSEVVLKSPEEIAAETENAALEIRKFRYKVFYEFTIPDSGNLYTGECYVYDPHAVSPGDIIEITYKPGDPMINFTDYSMPAGYLAK